MLIVLRKRIVIGVDIIESYDIRYYTVFTLEILLFQNIKYIFIYVTYVYILFVFVDSHVALTNQTHLHGSLEEL